MGRLSVVVATLIFTVSANAQPLDLQATCAAQARKAFNEFEREWKNDPANKAFKTLSTDYQGHYNTKLKKCLMLITMMGNQSQTSVYLSDAYERRLYAEYLSGEVPPITCQLVPSLRQKKYCTSREEFDAFVAEYMEESELWMQRNTSGNTEACPSSRRSTSLPVKFRDVTCAAICYSRAKIRLSPQTTLPPFVLLGLGNLRLLILFGDKLADCSKKNPFRHLSVAFQDR